MEDGVYEVIADMAFFTGKTIKVMRTRDEVFDDFNDFPISFENPEQP